MSIAEIRQLPLNEKLQIMEALWEDLRSHTEHEPIPDWHKTILDERKAAVESGQEEVIDWEEAKARLRDGLA